MKLKHVAHIKLNPEKAFNSSEETYLEFEYGSNWRQWTWKFVEFIDSENAIVEANGVIACINTEGIEFELEHTE